MILPTLVLADFIAIQCLLKKPTPAREPSPAARSAVFCIMILSLGGDTRPGGLEKSCAAARGTTIAISRAAPTVTGITPTTATTTTVFGWCCGRPMFFRPFFWFRHPGGTVSRDTHPGSFRQCGPIRASGWVRRGEGRRTALDRSGPRACREAGRSSGHRPRRAEHPRLPPAGHPPP